MNFKIIMTLPLLEILKLYFFSLPTAITHFGKS